MPLSSSGNNPYRVALLGTGVISVTHIAALKALGPRVQVVAACDLDLAKARGFQQEHGLPAVYNDLNQMLAEVKPDVVHVLLPPTAHAAAAETCLAAGAHVFVEKPFCISSDECRRVLSVAERTGLQVGVNHNLAYDPSFLELIDAARSCRLGGLEHVNITFAIPWPGFEQGPHTHWMFSGTDRVILELGPHPLSLACRLLGRVLSASTAVAGELKLTNGTRFFRNWQTSLVCERGTAQVFLSVGGGYYARSAHVIGEDGEAFADMRRNNFEIREKTPYMRIDDLINASRNGTGVLRRGLRNLKLYAQGAMGLGAPYQLQTLSVNASVSAFYRALAAGHAPIVDGVQGAAVVEACEKVIDSAYVFLEAQGGRGAAA